MPEILTDGAEKLGPEIDGLLIPGTAKPPGFAAGAAGGAAGGAGMFGVCSSRVKSPGPELGAGGGGGGALGIGKTGLDSTDLNICVNSPAF